MAAIDPRQTRRAGPFDPDQSHSGGALLKRPDEGPPAQQLAGLRPLLDQFAERGGDVHVDFPVLPGAEPGKDADLGDEQVVLARPRVLGDAGERLPILDRESPQLGTPAEDGADARFKLGIDRAHEAKLPARERRANRGIPDPDPPKTLDGRERAGGRPAAPKIVSGPPGAGGGGGSRAAPRARGCATTAAGARPRSPARRRCTSSRRRSSARRSAGSSTA